MYVPKEISLDSYNAPPCADKFLPKPYLEKNVSFAPTNPWTQTNGKQSQPLNFKVSSEPITSPWHEMEKQASNNYSQPNWIKPQPQSKPYNYKPTHYEAPKQQPQYQPHTIKPQYQSPQPQYQSPQPQYQSPQPQYQPTQQPHKSIQFRGQQQFNHNTSNYNSQNFNTAARGWGGSKMGNCYKPITFGNQTRRTDCMQYTDF